MLQSSFLGDLRYRQKPAGQRQHQDGVELALQLEVGLREIFQRRRADGAFVHPQGESLNQPLTGENPVRKLGGIIGQDANGITQWKL